MPVGLANCFEVDSPRSYGEIKRRDLREAWERHCVAFEGREVKPADRSWTASGWAGQAGPVVGAGAGAQADAGERGGGLMTAGIPRIPEPREWVLHKKCSKCSKLKPWALYSPKTYAKDGAVATVQSYCRSCHASTYREYQCDYRRANQEWIRTYKSDWAKRRRAQMQQESVSNNRGRLPAAPLHAFLWRRVMEMEEPSWAELAETCGVPDRSIRRVLVQENVSLSFADKVCTALDSSIYDLWPHLQEMAA